MTGSQFLAFYKDKGARAWEAAALDLARRGEMVQWPLRPVHLTLNGRTVTIDVTSDYFAVGTPSDFLRVPLTPGKAQEVADLWGMLLPTPAMVKAIHEQADVRVPFRAMPNNLGANLAQYAAQDAFTEDALAAKSAKLDDLKSGMKKDIVLGKVMGKNRLAIYGAIAASGVPAGPDPFPMMTASWRVQPYSPAHDISYVDYSHGVRFVAPTAKLDGRDVSLASILKDPDLSKIVSWEGALPTVRYATASQPSPGPYAPNLRLDDLGLEAIRFHQAQAKKT